MNKRWMNNIDAFQTEFSDKRTMDEKHRRILDRNVFLLVKNMMLTEEFYDCLRQENVLPETMIKDIEVS